MNSGGQRGGRRKPRPTIRFLQRLPIDSFPDVAQARLIAAKRWSELAIGEVRHPLIDDAVTRFDGGLPDQFKSATKAAREPVYELRSRSGAAWRAAAILDEAGDPWLIWADKHDPFLRDGAAMAKNLDFWRPSAVEYKLRQREEAAADHLAWRIDATAALLRAIAAGVGDPGQANCELPSRSLGECFALSIP